MANVIFPILSTYLTIGITIDIKTYKYGTSGSRIYNENDVVENQLNSFNASYYVLPDETIPYDKVRVPIDYLLQAKTEGKFSSKKHWLHGYELLTSNYADNALILVVAEYQTSEQAVKENPSLVPNWQENIMTSHPQTHYVDKIVFGHHVISLIQVRSDITGDVPVLRRILKEVMGVSGHVTSDTVELWKKAKKTIIESPDVRGEVFFDTNTVINVHNMMNLSHQGAEGMLRYVSEFPKNVEASPDEYYTVPLYVSCKLLHDLDERYSIVQKDEEGERYFTTLYRMWNDLKYTQRQLTFVIRNASVDNLLTLFDLDDTCYYITQTIKGTSQNYSSLYDYIDKAALEKAFDQYQQGLDNGTENYLTQVRKVREQMSKEITCGEDFLSPARGILKVADNETLQKGKVECVEVCKNFCIEEEHCRAIGYSGTECLVYYRSSNTATITLPEDESDDMKIYDRECRFEYHSGFE